MSLKIFHIVFITLSVLLAFAFGLWLLFSGAEHNAIVSIVAALLSFGVGILLIIYEVKILKKFKAMKSMTSR
jgi:hypothetical protein